MKKIIIAAILAIVPISAYAVKPFATETKKGTELFVSAMSGAFARVYGDNCDDRPAQKEKLLTFSEQQLSKFAGNGADLTVKARILFDEDLEEFGRVEACRNFRATILNQFKIDFAN